jgi:hypothetical protein
MTNSFQGGFLRDDSGALVLSGSVGSSSGVVSDRRGESAGVDFPKATVAMAAANDPNPYIGYPASAVNAKGERACVYYQGPSNTLSPGGSYVTPGVLRLKISADGQQWPNPFTPGPVVIDGATLGMDPRDPCMYVAPQSSDIYLSFFGKKWTPGDTSYTNLGLYLSKSTDQGRTFATPVQVMGAGYVSADTLRLCLDGKWRWPAYRNSGGGYVAVLLELNGTDPLTDPWFEKSVIKATVANSAECDFIEIDEDNFVALIRGATTGSENLWATASHNKGTAWDVCVQITNTQKYDAWGTLRRGSDGALYEFVRAIGGGLRVLRCTTLGQYAVQNIVLTGVTAGTFPLTVVIPSGTLRRDLHDRGVAWNARGDGAQRDHHRHRWRRADLRHRRGVRHPARRRSSSRSAASSAA